MVVVNECAIEDYPAMRLESACNHVCCVGGRPAISGGAQPPLGVGLHHETSEIGDAPVDLNHLLAPPFRDPRIERVERIQTANDFRAAQIDGQRKLNAPWA